MFPDVAGMRKFVRIQGINEKTFAICVCCLAMVAATADGRILPFLFIGAVVSAIARHADVRRERIREEHESK